MQKSSRDIGALFRSLESAGQRDDVKGAADHIDFPFISTSTMKNGKVVSHSFSREQFLSEVEPSSGKGDMHDVHTMAPHKPRVVKWIGNEIAFVEEKHAVGRGSKRRSWTAISQLVKKGGKWKLKSMSDNAGVSPLSKCLYCLFKSACCKP
jgi:hypothetical protein